MTENDFEAGKDTGMILGELKSINQRLTTMETSFIDFKSGTGKRVEDVEKIAGELSTKMNFVLWIGGKVFAPILTALGTGLVGLIAWQYFKK